MKTIKRGQGIDPVDAHVGCRIRMCRARLNLSQDKLGNKLGVSFQQVQKYENGSNRVGASRLYHIAHVLGVPVTYFFDGLDEPFGEDIPKLSKKGMQVAHKFSKLSKKQQDAIVKTLEAMCDED